jgi:acyl-CoA thioester hydrolase
MSYFEVTDRVRWSDCDPMGIIRFGAYLRLFEIAEHEMFRACGLPYETLRLEGGVWLPRKAFSAEFHSPAEMDEEIVVRSTFHHVGTTSLTMHFEAMRASDLVLRATASLTIVCVKKETLEKYPLPDWVREKIQRYVKA